MRLRTPALYGPYALGALSLALHLAFAPREGYFSDETYFIDCSNHLAFGYFDITPLVPFLIRISRWVFGDSLLSVRFFPALGHAATVILGGMVALELGGGALAAVLAALCLLIAPGYLELGGLFLTPSLEPFFWTLMAYLVIRILNGARTELWLAAGAALGLGYMNKPSILLFAGALILALSATPSRRFLRSRWLAGGALVALFIVTPNLLWQLRHDWNTLVFLKSLRNSQLFKDSSGLTFLLAPVFALHPMNALIWITGLAYLVVAPAARAFRAFGWAFVTVFAVLAATGGKAYYLAGAYPFLLAAGAVAAEGAIRRAHVPRRPAAASVLGLYAVAGALLAPAGLPIYSADETDRFIRDHSLEKLSRSLQLYGTRHDAEGKAREAFLQALARAYFQLAPAERAGVRILTSHYFEASWINVLGRRLGLPRAVSGNNSYYLWGPGDGAGEITIAAGFSDDTLRSMFRDVARVPGAPTLAICRRPSRPIQEIWDSLKSPPFV